MGLFTSSAYTASRNELAAPPSSSSWTLILWFQQNTTAEVEELGGRIKHSWHIETVQNHWFLNNTCTAHGNLCS